MSIHLLFLCLLKKHSKFYDFDIQIVKNTLQFKFHVGLHSKPDQHVILARFYKYVGQRFSFIFSFANMFVPKANRTNMSIKSIKPFHLFDWINWGWKKKESFIHTYYKEYAISLILKYVALDNNLMMGMKFQSFVFIKNCIYFIKIKIISGRFDHRPEIIVNVTLSSLYITNRIGRVDPMVIMVNLLSTRLRLFRCRRTIHRTKLRS